MQIYELKSDRVDLEALTVLARTALQLMRLIATGVITRENAAILGKWFVEIRGEYGHEALEAVMCYLQNTDRSGTIMKAIEDRSPRELFADVIPEPGSPRAQRIARYKREGQARVVPAATADSFPPGAACGGSACQRRHHHSARSMGEAAAHRRYTRRSLCQGRLRVDALTTHDMSVVRTQPTTRAGTDAR